ncbi:MAG: DUF3160 domain-containing protein [bacterium]
MKRVKSLTIRFFCIILMTFLLYSLFLIGIGTLSWSSVSTFSYPWSTLGSSSQWLGFQGSTQSLILPFTSTISPFQSFFPVSASPLFPVTTQFSFPFSYGFFGFLPYSWPSSTGFQGLASQYYYPWALPSVPSEQQPSEPPQETPEETPPPATVSQLQTEAIDLSDAASENRFIRNYRLKALDFPLEVPPYTLPLVRSSIANFNDFVSKFPLSASALQLLENNGFVVVNAPNKQEEDIVEPYKFLKDQEIPVFITTDSLLHLYHIQFDETLRMIEEKEFYDGIWQISMALLNASIATYNNSTGDMQEAAKRNAAYCAVALYLLAPQDDQLCTLGWQCNDPGIAGAYFTKDELAIYSFTIPDFVKSEVEAEYALINAHQGFASSPLFIYKEDYSQYVPRGHYTRSEKLKNYFKTFMWYGRISMLLKGSENLLPGQTDPFDEEGLISLYDAKIQTIQALLIAAQCAQSDAIKATWDRIYEVTAFYVGLSDDLGPNEYIKAMNSVFGKVYSASDFTDENLGALKATLAEYRPPKIFGGTGNCGIEPPFSVEQADECLEKTKGFRLMGQRFIPDSYMFSQLVGAYTDVYTGDKGCEEVFTCVISGAGRRIRGFPRGLDVMALLGSTRAQELLRELGDDDYLHYYTQRDILRNEFSELTDAEWNQNLYWAWLFSLKPLLKEFGAGYPSFMHTEAWHNKALTTALASWAELRHDTILYAKQSYTMVELSYHPPAPEKPVVGYIEPVPEFYNRLLSLTRMTTQGLETMKVLDSTAKSRLQSLENILGLLVDLSEKELRSQELASADYEFIKNFGDALTGVIADVDEKAQKTTIVADVHTEGNTRQVLEEGLGYVKLIIVAYKVPDGRILLGAGPVMSYYEFPHPMHDRLTDESWRSLLRSAPPQEPAWVKELD